MDWGADGKADEVLIDDWAGRSEAGRRRLNVTGTLGVLASAHPAGLLDFDWALARLRTTNFRLSAEVERLVRRRLSGREWKPRFLPPSATIACCSR